jgi:hypothetical protein
MDELGAILTIDSVPVNPEGYLAKEKNIATPHIR